MQRVSVDGRVCRLISGAACGWRDRWPSGRDGRSRARRRKSREQGERVLTTKQRKDGRQLEYMCIETTFDMINHTEGGIYSTPP